jgi:sugar phosphate isomerase/epimerase
MRILQTPPVHLTYCLNVHPGETWSENFAAIKGKAMKVRSQVAPNRPFGLGLRLSAMAARELANPAQLQAFGQFLTDSGLYVFTINGFPFGQFHGAAVKQEVYRPDWTTRERRDYTIQLADLLAQLLPAGVSGSISTVPVSYGQWIQTPEQLVRAVYMLCDVALHLRRVANQFGKTIVLALEPEPDCHVQTTAQAIEFINGPLMQIGADYLATEHGVSRSAAAQIIRRHIGICLDTAHLAVQFEDPLQSLTAIKAAGVTLAKVQLSAALEVQPNAQTLARLAEFCDPVYLHQTRIRAAGRIDSFPDLSDAIASFSASSSTSPERERREQTGAPSREIWRVHFHVPLFWAGEADFGSTRRELTGKFAAALAAGACEHLEIETYTMNVLPAFLRPADITRAIAMEYQWVQETISL